jgi:hypothetical protein
MVGRVLGLILLALAAAPSLAAPAPAPPLPPLELTLDQQSGFVVPVEINGVELRLRVDPAASGLVVLNPAAARRAHLAPELAPPVPYIPGAQYRKAFARIGPVSLTGRTAEIAALVYGRPASLRIIWFDRDALADADGLISPAALPAARILFRLAPPRAGESERVVALDYLPEIGLYRPYPIDARTLPVQYSLWRQSTVATAAAGALIAGAQGGAWRGAYARQPVNFGVLRPVRAMGLQRPVELDGVRIGRLLVRTGDYRGNFVLPGDTPDPDEIIVTAAAGPPQTARLNLTLGRDQLADCSSLAYEAATRRLTLRCGQPAPVTDEPRSRNGATRVRTADYPAGAARSGTTDALRFPLN